MKNSKIIAWKCYDTGKVFESESRYREHRFEYVANRRMRNHRDRFVMGLDTIFANFRKTAKSINEISDWLLFNAHLLDMHARATNNYDNYRPSPFHINDVSWEKLVYNDRCSNYHSAPINGGVTNWGGRDHRLPTEYRGWDGRLTIKYSRLTCQPYNILTPLGVFFGTGGGSSESYSGDITMFVDDWPALYEEHISNRAHDILVNG